MHRYPLLTLATAVVSWPCHAVDLTPATNAAFDHYVQVSEQHMQNDLQSGPFLRVDGLPPERREEVFDRLKRGEVVTRKLDTLDRGAYIPVPEGLIHHWMGTVFIPGASLQKTLALLQSYDQHFRIYAPRVLRSKLIQHNDDNFKFSLRLRETKIITDVLDTEYDAHYVRLDPTRAFSQSYSTRIAEVENAGKPDENKKPAGEDNGYLWRLNSYWRFFERDGGTYVQLEAISLTRDIPEGLGWLVRPFITSIPQESLVFTLQRTRAALE